VRYFETWAIKKFRELRTGVRSFIRERDGSGDLARRFHPLRQILERIPVDSWPISGVGGGGGGGEGRGGGREV